eukprot:NODE_2362_length_1081_cov_59.601677_g2344_i0.p1 GENE.NODE_2362_length_1081_cov_59.601677_g2344_i0~~NODE_2362_length_1081_cov_59.601677_g2344_i0.p1  ORF type:complete len:301 (+),score=50.05 NODE_2362_length_1081_cov_59.601677_g2344_i0:139-1041(+)
MQPKCAEALIGLAEKLYGLNRYEEAFRAAYQSTAAKEPTGELTMLMAKCMAGLKLYRNALLCFEYAPDLDRSLMEEYKAQLQRYYRASNTGISATARKFQKEGVTVHLVPRVSPARPEYFQEIHTLLAGTSTLIVELHPDMVALQGDEWNSLVKVTAQSPHAQQARKVHLKHEDEYLAMFREVSTVLKGVPPPKGVSEQPPEEPVLQGLKDSLYTQGQIATMLQEYPEGSVVSVWFGAEMLNGLQAKLEENGFTEIPDSAKTVDVVVGRQQLEAHTSVVQGGGRSELELEVGTFTGDRSA